MTKHFVAAAAIALSACGGTKAATIPANYNPAAVPQNGAVIGVVDMAAIGRGGLSPGMSQSVRNTATKAKFSLAFVESGQKSDFYVSLPAGPYRFVGGDTTSGLMGRKVTADWNDTGITFQVYPGRVTCVGAVVGLQPEVSVGSALASAFTGSQSFEIGVSDVCDPLAARFVQKYPALTPYLVKALAVKVPEGQ